MFKIAKAVLPAQEGGNLEENSMPFKSSELAKKAVKLNANGKGLNFFDADGSFFAYVRFSKKVLANIKNGSLTLAQALSYGGLVKYETEINGEAATLYTLSLPEELRGGDALNVAAIIKTAKPIQKKAASLEEISAILAA